MTLPLYAWIAVLFGVALHRQWGALTLRSRQHASLLAALQFLFLFTMPSHFLPSPQARQQARNFLAQMSATPGDIYVIDGVADLAPARKISFANGVAVWDVIRAGDSPASRALLADIRESLQQHSYAALLAPYRPTGTRTFVGEPPDLSKDYRLDIPPMRDGEDLRALQILQNPGVGPAYLFPARH